MLVHHADAGIERGARVARRQRLAEGLDRALVGDIVAEQDVHQRGLAGAVLAEQRDDLAARELEGDRVVGDKRPEALGDAGEAEDGMSGRLMIRSSPLWEKVAERSRQVGWCGSAGAEHARTRTGQRFVGTLIRRAARATFSLKGRRKAALSSTSARRR